MSDLVWFDADGKQVAHEDESAAVGHTPAAAEALGLKFKADKAQERDAAAEAAENMRLANLDGSESDAPVVKPVKAPVTEPTPTPEPAPEPIVKRVK